MKTFGIIIGLIGLILTGIAIAELGIGLYNHDGYILSICIISFAIGRFLCKWCNEIHEKLDND